MLGACCPGWRTRCSFSLFFLKMCPCSHGGAILSHKDTCFVLLGPPLILFITDLPVMRRSVNQPCWHTTLQQRQLHDSRLQLVAAISLSAANVVVKTAFGSYGFWLFPLRVWWSIPHSPQWRFIRYMRNRKIRKLH